MLFSSTNLDHKEEDRIFADLLELDRVVRAGQPDGILTNHLLTALDLETLISMMKSNSLLNLLGSQPKVWHAMIDQYFPYLRKVFPDEYRDDPKGWHR